MRFIIAVAAFKASPPTLFNSEMVSPNTFFKLTKQNGKIEMGRGLKRVNYFLQIPSSSYATEDIQHFSRHLLSFMLKIAKKWILEIRMASLGNPEVV